MHIIFLSKVLLSFKGNNAGMSQLLKSNQTLVIKSPNILIHMLFGHYIMHQICLYMYYMYQSESVVPV